MRKWHRRMFLLVGAGAAAGVILSSRVFQVGIFVIAAGFRRFASRSSKPRPGEHAHEWLRLKPPHEPVLPLASKVAITYHPWYQGFHAAEVARCLEEAAAMGAGYVRSDVRWSDVMPDARTPDEGAFGWYRSYFKAARDWYGLRPLIVLSEPPKSFKHLNGEMRIASWKSYIEAVMLRLGDLCDVYQVLNEPNNPVYGIFSGPQTGAALKVASETIRKHEPHSTIVTNLSIDIPNWKPALAKLLTETNRAVDVIGIDYYPGTWSLRAGANWSAVMDLAAKVKNQIPGSMWSGHTFAIMETGYATNVPGFRTERQQRAYFQRLEQVSRDLHAILGSELLLLIGIYELCDSDSYAFLDPEAHFGLLTSTLKRKLAFLPAQRLCSLLSEAQPYGAPPGSPSRQEHGS